MKNKNITSFSKVAESLTRANKGLELISENKYNLFYNKYKMDYPNLSDDEIREKIYTDKSDEIQSYKNLINFIDFSELDSIKDISNLSMIKGLKRNTFSESIKIKDNFLQNTFQMKDFFEEYMNYDETITSKEQTPYKFLKKVISFNDKISMSFEDKKALGSRKNTLTSLNKIQKADKFSVFDLETFAGENEAGIRTFGGITEYAFGTYKKESDGSIRELDKNVSIIGFNKDTTNDILSKIRQYQNEDIDKIPNEVKVSMSALGKMGHSKTKFSEIDGKPGLFKFESYPSDEDKGIFNIDNIVRGAERYNHIYNIQQSTIGSSGAPTIEEDLIDAIYNAKDNMIVGYNINQADLPWLDMQINKMSDQGKKYAESKLGGLSTNIKPENYLDMLAAIDFYEEQGKRNALDFYQDTNILGSKNGIRKTKKQQSSIVEAVVGNLDEKIGTSLAAHSAEYDITALAHLVNDSSFMKSIEVGVEEGLNDVLDLNIKNSAFMTTNTQSSGQYYNQGPLSFSYDPNKKDSVKTMFGHYIEDLKNIKSPKDIRSEHQDYGRKKDSLVKINRTGKVTLSEDFSELAKGFADNQAIQDMYFIDIGNITNKNSHEGSKHNTVMFFENEEKYNAYLSSLKFVGEKNAIGEYQFPSGEYGDKIKSQYAKIIGDNENIEIQKLKDFNELIEISDQNISVSSASRNIRGQNYSKTKKFLNLKERIEKDPTVLGGSKDDIQLSMEVAKQVSSNNVIGEITRDELSSLIGYKGPDGKNILHQETIDNMIESWDVLSSMEPVTKEVINYLDNKNLSTSQKNEYYDYIMKGINSEISSTTSKNLLSGEGNINDIAKNLNYINLDPSKIFKGSRRTNFNSPGKEEYIKIDFNKDNPEYGLINSLIKHSGQENRIMDHNKELKVLSMLDKTINHLSKEDEFSKYIDKSRYYDDQGKFLFKDPGAIASLLVDDLSVAKRTNEDPLYGIKDTSQLVKGLPKPEEISDIIKEIDSRDGGIKGLVENIGSKVKSLNTDIRYNTIGITNDSKDKNRIEIEARNIINKTLFNEVTSNELEEHLLSFGYTEKAASYIKDSVDRTAEEMTEQVATMISKGSKVGLDFAYGDDSLIISSGSDIIEMNMPKLTKSHGGFNTRLGNVDVAYYGIIEDSSKGLKLGSTITNAFNNVYNPFYKMNENDDVKDIFKQVERYNKDIGAALREAPVVDATNQKQRMMPYLLDFNATLDKLPEWNKKGLFEGAKFKEDNFVSEILNNEDFSHKRLRGQDRELLAKDYPIAMKYILENHPEEIKDPLLKEALSNISYNVGEKNLSVNIASVFNQAIMPGDLRGDNPQRPLIWQTAAAQEFRESHFIEAFIKNDVDLRNVKLGDTIITDQMLKTRTSVPEGMKERLQRAVTLKKANMDPLSLRLSVGEALLGIEERGDLNKIQRQKLANSWKSLSTYEDESIGGKLMFDLYGHKEKQYISVNDDMLLSLDDPYKMEETTKVLDKISPKINRDEDGNIIGFKYGESNLVEKEDVIYRELSLDGEGETPYGSKMELGFMGFKFAHKNTKLEATEEEVQDYINNILVESPEVRDDDHAIFNKLKKQFNTVLVVEDAERSLSYKTLSDSGEKGMTRTAAFSVGEYDSSIDRYFEENLKDTKAYKLKGKVPTKKALDELIDPYFVETDEYKTAEEFKEAILEEQMTPSDLFFKEVIKGKADFVSTESPNHENKFMEVKSKVDLMAMMLAEEEDVELDTAIDLMFNEMEELGLNPFKMNMRSEDGSLIMPTEVSDGEYIDLNVLSSYAKQKGYAKNILSSDGKEIIGTQLGVYDEDIHATISSVSVAKAKDFDGASYSKRRESTDSRTEELRNRLKEELEKPESDRNLLLIDSLKNQIQEKEKVGSFFDRRAKMGERELGLLKQTRVTDNTVNLFQSKIEDGTWTVKEAKDRLGHMFDFDEDGIAGIKKEYEGKALAGQLIENMQNSIFNKYHNTMSLEEALKKDPEKYGYLSKTSDYLKEKGVYADLKTAIEYDELGQSIKAVDFNMSDRKNIDQLKDSRFRQISISDINMPGTSDANFIERQGDSYLTDNMLVDLGEDMEEVGKRYLAIPKLNRKSGDQVIKFEHQRSLESLQARRYELDQLYDRYDPDSQEVMDAKSKLSDSYDKVVDSLKDDVYAQKGLIDSFATIELDGAYMGKTSSVVNIDLNDVVNGKIGNEITQERAKKLKESGFDIDSLNFSSLDKALLDGKSLAEHAEEGSYVGASFLSESAFEDMGFFSDSYLKRVSEASKKDITREDMIELLSTEGVTAISERYPAIDTGSLITQNIYLSNELSGNTVKITAEQQIAMHGDNDGDLQRSVIVRDSKGRDSIIAGLTGEVDNTFKEARALQYQQTFGVTEEWRRAVDQNIQKEFDRSLEGGLLNITNNDILNQRLSSNVDGTTYTELDTQLNKWEEIEVDIFNKFEDVKDKSDITEDVLNQYLSGLESPDERAEKLETTINQLQIIQNDAAALAKYKKLSIGEANIPSYQIRRFADIKLEQGEWSEKDVFAIQSLAYEGEQAVISAKNELATYANTNREYLEALNHAVRESDGSKLKDWFMQSIDEDKLDQRVELGKASGVFEDDFTREDLVDLVTDRISSMDSESKQGLDYLSRVGASKFGMSGYGIERALESVVEEDTSLEANLLKDIAKTHDMEDVISVGKSMSEMEESFVSETLSDNALSFIDNFESIRSEERTSGLILESIESIHEGVMKSASNLDSKALAIGALGIAASTMAIGSILGDPTKGYEEEREPEEGNLYEDTTLVDDDLGGYSREQRGYVINVNANNRRSKKQINRAIETAMATGNSTDINISMNINDNTREITEKYVQDLLSSSM